MIFTRTKRAADRVAEDLDFRGFAVAAVHGDLGQGARERALRAFRTGKIDVLVATDVAARGLDVSGVTHVINYDCPEDPDTYTHRIGRTGRAGATGVAVTFVDWEDMPRWVLIDKSMGLNMPQPPETYHTSPALYADLDIPTDISGTLPTAERNRAGLAAEVEEDLGGGRRRTRDGGRGPGRGRGGRSRGGNAGEETSAQAPEPADETSGRPRRQRRRRRVDEPISGAESAESTPAENAAGPDDTDTVTTPSGTRSRSRRRGGRGNRGSGGGPTAAAASGSTPSGPAAASGSTPSGPAAAASGSAPGGAAAEMSGGSEAGVGTTADG